MKEHESVKSRTDEQVKAFRRENQMSVRGDNIPRPVTTFEEAGFPKYISDTLAQQNFPKPTCIQS